MAMVLSQKTKMVCGALLTFMLLGSVLVTGSALGWFNPGGSGDLPGELTAKLSQRRLYGNQVDQEDGEDGSSGREGSAGVDSGPNLPPFPPPPPGLDGFPSWRGEKGERGPKGPPGDCVRGPPGPPGPMGPSGPPGISGPGSFSEFPGLGSGSGDEGNRVKQIYGEGYGPPGQCSCNMTQILQSFTMPEMLQGPPGPPGTDGKTGAPGLTGQAGPTGERGATGSRGERGERGDGGAPGVEGPRGPKGEAGLDGKPGTAGPPGPPGPASQPDHGTGDESVFGSSLGSGLGRPGTPGPKGEPGPAGNIGIQGERGLTGHKGERGESGLKGHKGERGHNGPVGPAGVKGDRGPSGIDGLPGLPGANGQPADKGEKGEYGPQGKPGPPGPPGAPIADGASGDEWMYSASGNGMEKSVRGVEGPKGDKGEIGAKGEKGSRGVEGPQGFPGNDGKSGERGQLGPSGLPGIEGPTGPIGLKGERGERGPPGPISVATGSDFVTVKGDKGDEGPRGKRGKPGPPGPAGKSGTMGEIGLPGYMNSPKGRPGNMGPQGPQGVPGVKGEKGDSASAGMYAGFGMGQKGERGYDGTPGVPGLDGARGPPGPAGHPGPPGEFPEGHSVIGVPGPPGPPGPPGLSFFGQKGEPGMTMRSHVYGDASFSLNRQATKSPLDELKALKDHRDMKDFKDGETNAPHGRRPIPEEEYPSGRVAPGALTFQNTDAMTKMSDMIPVGTIAYIIDEEALLVRVTKGWQYISMGSILPITTPPAPTMAPPQARPVFQSSNLIKNVPIPEDGPIWFPKMLRMAALNEPVSGDQRGVTGADHACFRQAIRVGLKGTFRAFLSSRDQNVDSIVKQSDQELPIVNTKGDILFNSWVELFDGQGGLFTQQPRIYSFSGKNILTDPTWRHKIVWHGSHAQGERAMETYCDAWHSDSPDKVGLASSLHGKKLLNEEKHPCSSRFAVLCIEVASPQSRRRKRDTTSRFNLTNYEQSIRNAEDYQEFLKEILSD